ncbi:MAG: hypothetical protein KGZ88_15110 [Methylomicrobium sp.]|nr:hypothetical protein [Methylomicrobium sp.]
MNTAAIDRETLDLLFHNQNKLDKLFDSVFDDEKYFIDFSAPSSQSVSMANNYAAFDPDSSFSYENSHIKDTFLAIKSMPLHYLLLIAFEFGSIYWLLTSLF